MNVKTEFSSIYVNNFDLNINKSAVLFLHGFTQDHSTWDTIRKDIEFPSIAIDVPGHGRSTIECSDYSINKFSSDLNSLICKLELNKIHLCGYSMGGRLAIAFASNYPDLIESLILESSMLGLNKRERDKRKVSDSNLALQIDENYKLFIANWEKNNLFKYQEMRNPVEWGRQKMVRRGHNQSQLSHAMIAYSQGIMNTNLDKFSALTFPILSINGEDDSKYLDYSNTMMRTNSAVKRSILAKSGHNTHLENKNGFVNVLKNHLQ